MDIQTIFVRRKDSAESFTVTTDTLKDKDEQSYRGLAFGAPGNTPMHNVDYSDLNCVFPYLRTPTREELCMSPGAMSPNRSARIQSSVTSSESADSAFFTDDSNSQHGFDHRPVPSPGDEMFSCNMYLSDWVDSSGSSITCAQKPRKPNGVEAQGSSGIESQEEVEYEDLTTDDEDDNWRIEVDSDLCECGSECETSDPPTCNDNLFDGIQ